MSGPRSMLVYVVQTWNGRHWEYVRRYPERDITQAARHRDRLIRAGSRARIVAAEVPVPTPREK